jgi:hypothetical protein
VAEGGTGMRVIAAFCGPCAPDALAARVSVFSHDVKRFNRFVKLATSSMHFVQTSLYLFSSRSDFITNGVSILQTTELL